MGNWIPEWTNAYCPNCGKLTDVVYDFVKERRLKIYCKDCELMFDTTFHTVWNKKNPNEPIRLTEGKE